MRAKLKCIANKERGALSIDATVFPSHMLISSNFVNDKSMRFFEN
jgi:hypothetical protein